MTKTFDDYLNDPRIKDEPMGLRMTHAMRFKVQEETQDMTAAERTAYYHERTKVSLSRLNMTQENISHYED
jgi:Zn/Cd-binding protein ZinT